MQKRDELVGQLAVALDALKLASEQDVQRRTAISEMIGMYSAAEQYDTYGRNVKANQVLSWPKIYFHIGKLMQSQFALQYVEEIETFKLESHENAIKLKELWNEIASQKK